MTGDDELATVIPLSARPPAPARAAEILDRRVGPGWEALPSLAGRSALRAEDLLRHAPAGFDPAETPASDAVDRARKLVATARTALELLSDEVAVLSEALGADLDSLGFDELDAVATAVLDLSVAPPADPSWGRRAAAEAADVVLELIGPALRDAAAAHERLYERFTDDVWEVPTSLLTSGARPWRRIARHRLRRQLRDASRTGTLPGRVKALAREIVAVRATRVEVAPLQTILTHHLGVLDCGVLTDVDAAAAALAAVLRLQRSIELVLDDDRLERLLLADAFRSHELLDPARSIRRTLAAWGTDVEAAGGRGALALDAATLRCWADHAEQDLPAVASGVEGLEGIGVTESTLQQTVDALILREHVAQLVAPAELRSERDGTGSAS